MAEDMPDIGGLPGTYWHCYVKMANTKQYAVANDLTLDALQGTIVRPWHDARLFTVSGKVIDRAKAMPEEIKITMTEEPLSAWEERYNQDMRARGIFVSADRRMLPVNGGQDFTHKLLFQKLASVGPLTLGDAPGSANKEQNPESESIEMEPPGIVKQLAWLRKNGRKHWKVCMVALFILVVGGTVSIVGPELRKSLGSSGRIGEDAQSRTELPQVQLHLSNSGTEEVEVSYRGELFLWRPGVTKAAVGKFRLVNVDGTHTEAVIKVAPGKSLDLQADILDDGMLREFFETENCDISLYVHSPGGGRFSQDLPFTEAALNRYYVSIDVGAD